ncbi:hypothetical protein [Paracoccus versutus]|uniref:hypothetical protein n=1 Tax=Paracoccus versutus TaxID=34007 RepID=UPI001407AAC2|nr:hypothetical protein [Paracoccus versutus]
MATPFAGKIPKQYQMGRVNLSFPKKRRFSAFLKKGVYKWYCFGIINGTGGIT